MEKKVFHVIDEWTLKGEDYETKEAAINAAWSAWNCLTRSEKENKYRGFTVYEAEKIWNEDLESYDYDLYDMILDIHYINGYQLINEVNKTYEMLLDSQTPTLDEIYKTMKDHNLGNNYYDDDTFQNFKDDPELYIEEVLDALLLMVEVPEVKNCLNNLYAMHHI